MLTSLLIVVKPMQDNHTFQKVIITIHMTVKCFNLPEQSLWVLFHRVLSFNFKKITFTNQIYYAYIIRQKKYLLLSFQFFEKEWLERFVLKQEHNHKKG